MQTQERKIELTKYGINIERHKNVERKIELTKYGINIKRHENVH